ncbi:branched-chain amino acid ABC transporter [Nocardioides sp. GY 10113]|uniref:branched-chain amino acid transporter permease n=1 Tax=Nocardioides sp. GY 10113 TaxID=2569761 RepID=UPI0010A7B91F|nr:AzlD domain-containing protein [Nocardioides sp. GY 10113]TIC88853.1 branched-chain amino acid ABC transporter [Nocardioides sp. GY 10113]
MPDPLYLGAGLAVAIAVTVATRALPFAIADRLRGSALLLDLARWMPLGVVVILVVYCLSGLDLSDPSGTTARLLGAAVTIGTHLWRRNGALSILAGSTVCIALLNL